MLRLIVTHVSLEVSNVTMGQLFYILSHIQKLSVAHSGTSPCVGKGPQKRARPFLLFLPIWSGPGPCDGTANSCRKSANLQRAALGLHRLVSTVFWFCLVGFSSMLYVPNKTQSFAVDIGVR